MKAGNKDEKKNEGKETDLKRGHRGVIIHTPSRAGDNGSHST